MPDPSVSSIAIYQLRVVLRGVSPLIWRRLLVVSETSLGELHEMLQRAFGWSGEHLHRFLIHGVAYGIPHVGGIVFREDARRVPLSRFHLHCGERFRYEYDFTADWKLDIRLERALPFDPNRALPSCVGGKPSGTARRLRWSLGLSQAAGLPQKPTAHRSASVQPPRLRADRLWSQSPYTGTRKTNPRL